jgi:uncharacterized protein with GYD domain
MATFLMYGKYSPDALKEMSADRTQRAVDLTGQFGGKIESMYATLGEHDLVFVTSFPSLEDAIRASVELTRMTGISFATAPAVTVEEFDKMIS